jgi:UDP-glucuronate 4-epimerase
MNAGHGHQRVLLTGVAGFIGSHLAERLLARGDRVVGIDNFDPFYPAAEKRANLHSALRQARFRFVELDCGEAERLESALRDESFDVVVHCAAKAGVRASLMDPVGFARANVMGTQALLEFARQHDIRRLVFASSSSVYGNSSRIPFSEGDPAVCPVSPYAATKRAAELLCQAYHEIYGMSLLMLRFFTVYGPRQRPDLAIRKFATLLLRGEPVPMYGDGSSGRDYTWIEDIVAGTVAAIDRTASHPGECETINLGGNRITTLRDLIGMIAASLEVQPRTVPLPEQPGDVRVTWADTRKAERLLNYRPSTPLTVGLPLFLDWLKEHLATTDCHSAWRRPDAQQVAP